MKKAIVLAIAFLFVVGLTAPVLADHDPSEKFKKGVMDIISVPYDLGKTTVDEVKSSSFKPLGLVGGLIKGAYHGIKDVVSGVLDIATFPLDTEK